MLTKELVLAKVDATWAATTPGTSLDRGAVETAIEDASMLRRWLDGVDVALARRLHDLAVPDPEQVVARRARVDRRDAQRAAQRAATTDAVPEAAEALRSGDIAAGHVDALGAALARVDVDVRDQLVARGSDLIDHARTSTPDEFRQRLQREITRVEHDAGAARLARQRRNVSLRAFTDRDTGMLRLLGQYDPESGLALIGRLDIQVERLFHGGLPRWCPADPSARQDFLRAHALLALLGIRTDLDAPEPRPADGPPRPSDDRATDDGDAGADDTSGGAPEGGSGGPTRPSSGGPGNGTGGRRAEVIVVIDQRTLRRGPHADSVIDPGGPPGLELPLDAIRRLLHASSTRHVLAMLGPDGIVTWVSGGGRLDLGRTTRLANRAQRRALRVMYPTCAIEGCQVGFEHCAPHHVHWWEHGGGTDLHNLLPLCSRHHHAVHDLGWRLSLTPERMLTVVLPDGTRTTTGPPRREPR